MKRFGRTLSFSLTLLLVLSRTAAITAAEVEVKHESVLLKMVAPNRYHNGSRPAGVLYTPVGQSPKAVVIFIHPEGDSRNDWRSIPLAQNGIAAFGMAARYSKEDQHLIMEEVNLDLAEAIRFLKQERGFKYVILHGHSGGGSTVAFYQEQAETAPPHRVKSTPAGDPPDLNKFDLPKADGLILSAAHLGRGWATERKLDASVVDEDDPLSLDPILDMYNPENGYRPPPEWSHYTPEFKERFRTAQVLRMQRLIEKARGMVRERKMYEEMMKAPDFEKRPLLERLRIERGAIAQRYMLIYRNWANFIYADPTVEPDDRIPGAAGRERTDHMNYFAWYHPRVITPEAFLSSESTASNVHSTDTLKRVTVPLLVIIGSADPTARPGESRTAYETAATKDKEFVYIIGADHGYMPYGSKAGKGDQRRQVIAKLTDWLTKRYGQ